MDDDIARVAELTEANDTSEDNSESEEVQPKPKKRKMKKTKKSKKHNKRGTVAESNYGSGFEPDIFQSPLIERGPVLFGRSPRGRSAKYTKTPVISVESESEEIPKKKHKKSKNVKKFNGAQYRKGKGKKTGKKNAKLTDYDRLHGNYGSYEHDGFGTGDGNFDGHFYGGEAVSGEAPETNDYSDADYQENDYEDEEANEGGDYEEEANEGGEEDKGE